MVILDRDGTLIVEKNYLSAPEQVELLPGAAEGLRRFAESGWRRIVITNQSGVGRGYFSLDTVARVHDRMRELLALNDAAVDGIYVCPHSPETGCSCRKPATELVLQACSDWGVAPSDCIVIGDKASDIELGRNLGVPSILVRTGYGEEHLRRGLASPDFVVADLREAAALAESRWQ